MNTQNQQDGAALAPVAGSHLRWHRLNSITCDGKLIELLAATCEDGIGIIARWTRHERGEGGWDVEAMDTESCDMEFVTDFHEGEPVPPEPPTVFDDANNKASNSGA